MWFRSNNVLRVFTMNLNRGENQYPDTHIEQKSVRMWKVGRRSAHWWGIPGRNVHGCGRPVRNARCREGQKRISITLGFSLVVKSRRSETPLHDF
jgi:hypothetical protein